jgi:hypothetical protein
LYKKVIYDLFLIHLTDLWVLFRVYQQIKKCEESCSLWDIFFTEKNQKKSPIIQYFYWDNGKSNNLYRVYIILTTTIPFTWWCINIFIFTLRKYITHNYFSKLLLTFGGNGSCYRSTTIHYSQRVIILGYIWIRKWDKNVDISRLSQP